MTDEVVKVTIQENPISASIDTGTPQLTITELSGNTTVIEASSVGVVIAEENPIVTVNNGGTSAAAPISFSDLTGEISRLQLDSGLITDLGHLDSLWDRLGEETLLTYSDGETIQLEDRQYTDTSISTAVTSMGVSVDSKISDSQAAATLITDALDQRIDSVKDEIDVDIDLVNQRVSSIDGVNGSIATLNQRVELIDGVDGSVETLQDSMDQQIISVNQRVSLIDGAGGLIEDVQDSITAQANSIDQRVSLIDGAGGSIETLQDSISTQTGVVDQRLTTVKEELETSIDNTNLDVSTLNQRVTNIQTETDDDINTNTVAVGNLEQVVTANKTEIDGRLDNLDIFVSSTDGYISSTISRLNAIDGASGSIVDLQSSIEQTAEAIGLQVTSLESSIDNRLIVAEGSIVVNANSITSTVSRLDNIDGEGGALSLMESSIIQTANSIDQRITSVEEEVDGRFTLAESRIFQTENSIISTVSRLEDIDGANGSLALAQSSITQLADSIDLEVLARQEVNGNLIETQSNLSLLTDSVSLMASEHNEVEGRVTNAELILGVDGINISLMQSSLTDQAYSIGTMQSILTNQWSVDITEDAEGNTYATGFGLILHPEWLDGESYVVGDTVSISDTVYQCDTSHTSNSVNNPTEDGGSIYWTVLPDGLKSEFTVQADSFKVLTSSGPTAVFEVTGDTISLSTDVVVSGNFSVIAPGTTGYANITDAPTSLQAIDVDEYNLLNTANTNALQAISDASDALDAADGKITSFYQNSMPSGASIGDFWVDTDDGNKMYRYNGSVWSSVQDDSIGDALDAAQNAESLVDGKAEVFYSSSAPSGASIGDLWYDTDDPLKRTFRYNGASWIAISTNGATWGSDIANVPTSLSDLNASEYADLQQAINDASDALTDASTAISTVDGKITAFYALFAPSSGMSEGDIWFDLNDDNKMYCYTNSEWEVAQGTLIGTAIDAAQNAETIADGKAEVFYTSSAPSEATAGDLWYDTDDSQSRLYRFDGSSWTPIASYGATWGVNIGNQPTSLAELDTNADGVLSNLDDASYFPGTCNFNPRGKILLSDGNVAGWFAAYYSPTQSNISYYASYEALRLYNSSDSTIGMAGSAFPLSPGAQYTVSFSKRSSSSYASGFYCQIHELDTELSAGKYAISTSSSNSASEVQTRTRGVNLISDSSISTSWSEHTFTYTPTSTAKYASINFFNLTGMGTGALYLRNVRITLQATKPTSLADINSTEYSTLMSAGGDTLSDSDIAAMGYLKTVDDGDITSISGGKITTGIITGNNSYSYYDINNNKMYFSSSATLQFGNTATIDFGQYSSMSGDGGETIAFNYGQLYLKSNTGAYLYLYNSYTKLASDEYLYLDAGTSYRTYFTFGGTKKAQMNQYGFRPYTNEGMLLGDSSYKWHTCYSNTYYDGTGGYQDKQDDLVVLSELKPRKKITIDPETKHKHTPEETEINPDTGLEYLDLLSLPRWMTNYKLVVEKLKEENGDLLSEEDIDELIQDQEEAGWLLCRNIGAFNDLTSGGLRQLDIESKEIYELILSRLTALENENKTLKERITALEGKKD